MSIDSHTEAMKKRDEVINKYLDALNTICDITNAPAGPIEKVAVTAVEKLLEDNQLLSNQVNLLKREVETWKDRAENVLHENTILRLRQKDN